MWIIVNKYMVFMFICTAGRRDHRDCQQTRWIGDGANMGPIWGHMGRRGILWTVTKYGPLFHCWLPKVSRRVQGSPSSSGRDRGIYGLSKTEAAFADLTIEKLVFKKSGVFQNRAH